MYKLTAEQIDHFDIIHLDIKATERSLEIAINYAQNKLSFLNKDLRQWWKELAAVHDLDLEHNRYRVINKNGYASIVLVEEEKDAKKKGERE